MPTTRVLAGLVSVHDDEIWVGVCLKEQRRDVQVAGVLRAGQREEAAERTPHAIASRSARPPAISRSS